MEMVKAVVEEVMCISGYPHVAQNPESSLCGGCCEGTVFTFTSAGSNGKLRQRVRSRASTLKLHGRQEERTDPVFTEMRMMPPRREGTPADGEFLSAGQDFISTFPPDGPCGNSESLVEVQNSIIQTQSVGRKDSGKDCYLLESELGSNLEQPKIVEDEVKGITYSRGENYYESNGTGKDVNKQDGETAENISTRDTIHQTGTMRVENEEASSDGYIDDRNHRISSTGENFNQRKLSCIGKREQTIPARCIKNESVREEVDCRRMFQVERTEVRVASFPESNCRLQIEAELKNLQARHHVTGVKWSMIGRSQTFPDQEPPVVKDLDRAVSTETGSEVLREKEGQGKENGHSSLIPSGFASGRAEHVFPSKGPLARSFTSFNEVTTKREGKTFSFGGESFLRAESSSQKSAGKATCMSSRVVSSTKSFSYEPVGAGTMQAGHLLQDISRGYSGLSLLNKATPTTDTRIKITESVEAATNINQNLSLPLSPLSFMKQDLAWIRKSNQNGVGFSDSEIGKSSNTKQIPSSDLSYSFSGDVAERSEDFETGSSTSEEQECNWLAISGKPPVGHRFRSDSASVKECPTQRSRQIRPVVNRGLRSISLDWYGSTRSEDSDGDSCLDNDNPYFQEHGDEGDCFPRGAECLGPEYEVDDDVSPISSDGTLCRWEDNMEDDKENCKVRQREVSSLEAELKEGEGRITALHGELIRMDVDSRQQSMISKQAKSCVQKEDSKSSMSFHRTGRPKCDLGYATQCRLPIRRRAWRRSFKKTKKMSAERVNYMEKWLGRGRRKASMESRFSDFGNTSSQISLEDKDGLLLATQAVDISDTFPDCRSKERSMTPPTSLGNGYISHPTSERSETADSIIESGFCGESSMLEILGSCFIEDCNSGLPNSFPVRSEDLNNGEEISSKPLDRKEPLDFTTEAVKDALADQQCIQPDGKNAFSMEITSGEDDTESVPDPTNISTFPATAKPSSRHPRFQTGVGSHALTGKKSEVKLNLSGKDTFLGALQEPRDCAQMRSQLASSRRQDRNEGQEDGDDIKAPPASAVVTSYGSFLEESLGNEKVAHVSPNGHSGIRRPEEPSDIPKPVISRKPKIPIFVRAKNGLASGWLLQSFVWKKFGKQKLKAGDPNSLQSECISRKYTNESRRISNAGSASPRTVSELTNSKEPKERDVNACDPSTIRKNKIHGARQNESEGAAAPEPPSGEDFISETVRGTPTASENTGVREFCDQGSESNSARFDSESVSTELSHISAFKNSFDGDEKAERMILPDFEIPGKLAGRNSDVKSLDASEETAYLCGRDLHLQSSVEGRDVEARKTLESVSKPYVSREHGYSLRRSAELGVHDSGENDFSPPDDSIVVSFHTKGSFLSEGSSGDILGESLDGEVEGAYGRRKKRGIMNKSRCDLPSEPKNFPPPLADSAMSAHILGEDVLYTISAQESRLSGGESVSTKEVKEETYHLPPVILRSKDASSSSHRAECQGQLLVHCRKKRENSTLEHEDNSLIKSTASSGFVALLKSPGSEKGIQSSRDGISEVDKFSTSDTGNRPPSSPLDERSGFYVSEILEGEEIREEVVRVGQHEIPEQRHLIPAPLASTRNVDFNDTDRVQAGASSVCARTSRISKKQVGECEREEDAGVQTESTCQGTYFTQINPERSRTNKFDSTNSGLFQPSAAWTDQGLSTNHEERVSSDRPDQQPGRPDPWLSQGQEIHWQRKISEKGIGNMGVRTVADNPGTPAVVQGCRSYHPPPFEWNAVGSRGAQGSLLSFYKHGERISTSQNQSSEPIPRNEVQKSNAPTTFTMPGNCQRLENGRVVNVQPLQVWNLASKTDLPSFDHGGRKEHRNAFTDCHTQDEVFLERFSSRSDSQKISNHHKRPASTGLASGAPAVSAATSACDRNGFFRLNDKVIPVEQMTLAVNRESEPSLPSSLSSRLASPLGDPPAPLPSQTRCFSPSNILPLPYEPDKAHLASSNMIFKKVYHTCEPALFPDYRNSVSSISPCSSINEYSGSNPDLFPFKPKLCSHGSTGSGARYSDEAVDFKTFPTQNYVQTVPVPLPPSLVQNPTMALNSKRFCSSCRTEQPFCDTCNYSSCSKSSCNNQLPVCGGMLRQPQCHSEQILDLHTPAYALACPAETARSRRMEALVSRGHVDQYACNAGQYATQQTMPTRLPVWPVPDKTTETGMPGDSALQDCTLPLGKERDSGLVWLTGEEMNLIRELRQSVGKDSTRSSECLADSDPNHVTTLSSSGTGVRESSFCGGASNISLTGSISRCSNYSTCTSPRQTTEAGITTQTVNI
ncbi:hypothetical protein R1flu_000956 [Riccia fluitans]|uniref:Uncharacterized protein n=1 Tax=Riccia fluitans TaxID=41844 RepID=A0ABD1Y1X9_9MARC